jgi:hypothetical protein
MHLHTMLLLSRPRSRLRGRFDEMLTFLLCYLRYR